MILAGDIGATKTMLGLFTQTTVPGKPLKARVFPSQDYESLEKILEAFLHGEAPVRVRRACLAVAGPVLDGTAAITNLPWKVQRRPLLEILGLDEIGLINDVQALASSIPVLAGEDLHTLNAGKEVRQGTIAVIAPGTGLGEAFGTWDGSFYRSHPTEGGHADFAPADDNQTALLSFLRKKMDHVSWEMVCSGIGIPNIYDFLLSTGRYPEDQCHTEIEEATPERTPAIVRAALKFPVPCPLCKATLLMFTAILGSEAGNLALKTMSTGGLFVGGGIPGRILSFLSSEGFLRSFCAKGRLTPVMERIPVRVILNQEAALLGAAREAALHRLDG